MGLTIYLVKKVRDRGHAWRATLTLLAVLLASVCAGAQETKLPSASAEASFADPANSEVGAEVLPARSRRAQQFMGGRNVAVGTATRGAGSVAPVSAASAMDAARQQHVAMTLEQQGLAQQRASAQQGLHAQGVHAQIVGPRLSSLSAAWQPVGPGAVHTAAYGNVSGRVTAIAVDPADSTGNTVYVGSTGGGVWKSTNAAGAAAAVSFVPLTDTLPVFSANAGSSATASLSIGAVSVHGGVILAGTGDPNDAADSFYGSGVLRSADGGVTWTLVSGSKDGTAGNHSFTGLGFAGFSWSTTVPGLVVAAVSQAAEGVLVNAVDATNSVMGLYYSTDDGVTWQMSTVMDGSQLVQDPQPGGANNGGNAATAVVWNPVRQRFYSALRFHGYYESVDGANWTRLATQPGTGLTLVACGHNPGTSGNPSCPIFRGALAVEPVSGDMFTVSVDRNNLDQGLWQDTCSGSGSGCAGAVTFGKQLGGATLEVGGGNKTILQGDYNLALEAVSVAGSGAGPADTLLFAGTEDIYRCSLAAGCALRNATNAVNGCAASSKVAPAQHAIAAVRNGGQPLLFFGNDGGIWRSTDGVNQQGAVCSADDATHFDNLNRGLGSLAEVVSLAHDPTDAGTLLVGLGANGTAGTGAASGAGPGSGVWEQRSAGEGGTVGIDPTNPLLWYVSTAAGVSVKACASGAACAAADFAGTATIGPAQVSGDAALIDAAWVLDPLAPAEMVVGTCRVWRGPAADGGLWSSANAISKMFGGPSGAKCGSSNPLIRSLGGGGPMSSAGSAQNAGAQVLYAGMAGRLDGGGVLGGHVFSTTAGGTAGPTSVWTDIGLSPVINDVASAGKFDIGGFDVSSIAVDVHDATGKTVYVTVMGFAGNGTNAPHVYRSTDGGAHWTNISGNLPNAPGNSVLVDPNDANTVYVALDTGVYVTTQVASCSSTNCWSVYGAGLPNAPAIQLVAAAGLTTGDGRTGELRVGTYGRGVWQTPLLTATTAAQAGMSLQPTALTFALQASGTASAAQTVTVTNTGMAALMVSSVTVTGDFHATNNCAGKQVRVGGTCSVQVSFLPAAAGSSNGVLTIYGNVAGGQATAALAGIGGTAGVMVLNPVTLSFAATTVGATSAGQDVTISNTGVGAVALGAIAASGDFAVTANTCGSSLAAGVGCTVRVVFRPVLSGVRSGMLTVVDDAGTQTTELSGTGTSPATDGLSPSSLSFAVQVLNTASAAQQVTLTNAGDVALTLIFGQITAGDFVVVNGCGNSLNAHASCSMAVSFAPKSVGTGSGVLTVADQFRSQTVTLQGSGVAPAGVSLSPFGVVSFGPVGVGSSSAGQTVTLTNNDGVPLTLAGAAPVGDFVVVAGSNTCGSVLAVGAGCTLQVSFVPASGGDRSGTLTVTDSAPNSPQVLTLRGTGVDFTLATNGPANVTVAAGKSAVFPLLLSSGANIPGTAALSCAGAPVNAVCTVTPGSVVLGGATTVSVTVTTGATTALLRQGKTLVWLAWLMPLGLLVRRGRRVSGLVVLCLLAGCGSGRKIPGDSIVPVGGGATAAGSYGIVVSAASAGLVRVVNLTLVVQ